MRWRHPVLVGLIWALTPIAAATEEAGVSVRDAWMRETPPGVAMTAGYMVLQNKTSRSQVLMAARSSSFETVTIHRTIAKEGMTGMEHAQQIELLPNASLFFAPGGYHLMLLNPKRTLHAGDRVDITLEFRGGLVVPVAYEVRK
jgi:copper(I)-binding protein